MSTLRKRLESVEDRTVRMMDEKQARMDGEEAPLCGKWCV